MKSSRADDGFSPVVDCQFEQSHILEVLFRVHRCEIQILLRSAQTTVEIAISDPHGAWVDCDDLNNKQKNGVVNNDLHYTQPGDELLGRRYARQAKSLIDVKKPSDHGRPE